MNKAKLRLFLGGALLALAFLVSFPAAATCWECTYIWFVGTECDSTLEEGDSGKEDCNDTGRCYLLGGDCDGSSSCTGDGSGSCTPENKTLLDPGLSGSKVAEVKLASAGDGLPLCRYWID